MVSYLNHMSDAIRATNWSQIDALARSLKEVRAKGRKVYTCGNGGSHAVALHWGVDLPKVAHVNLVTLGTNMSLSSALSNDLDYEMSLSTELAIRADVGDVVIAMSCSGTSANISYLLREAGKMRLETFLITGANAPVYPLVKEIRVRATDYGILEDVFSAIGHYLTQELS